MGRNYNSCPFSIWKIVLKAYPYSIDLNLTDAMPWFIQKSVNHITKKYSCIIFPDGII